MATVPTREPLLTAEQFGERPDPGYPEELVRGRIVTIPPPKPRHGQICARAVYLLTRFLEENNRGHVLSNDSGVITERGPDTVRGADVAYCSYDRIPKGPLPDRYFDIVPELIIEVRSPSDGWPKVFQKASEYLAAGVSVVVVLDDQRRSAHVLGADGTARMLAGDEELTIPEILGDFRVAVRRFFE
jgi:Uma2 family endonuclease